MTTLRRLLAPLLVGMVIVAGVVGFGAHQVREAMGRPQTGRYGAEGIVGVDHVERHRRDSPARDVLEVTLTSDVQTTAHRTAEGLGHMGATRGIRPEVHILAPHWNAQYLSWSGRPNGPLVEWWLVTAARLHDVDPAATLTCRSEDFVCDVDSDGRLTRAEVARLVHVPATARAITSQRRDPPTQVTLRVLAGGRVAHEESHWVGNG